MSLCEYSDIVSCFGQCNVDKWADLDKNCDPVTIQQRVEDQIECSCNYILGCLRAIFPGIDECKDKNLKTMCIYLTGHDLYMKRGYEDGSEANNEMRPYYSRFKTMMKQLYAGQLALEGCERPGTISEGGITVVDTDTNTGACASPCYCRSCRPSGKQEYLK